MIAAVLVAVVVVCVLLGLLLYYKRRLTRRFQERWMDWRYGWVDRNRTANGGIKDGCGPSSTAEAGGGTELTVGTRVKYSSSRANSNFIASTVDGTPTRSAIDGLGDQGEGTANALHRRGQFVDSPVRLSTAARNAQQQWVVQGGGGDQQGGALTQPEALAML